MNDQLGSRLDGLPGTTTSWLGETEQNDEPFGVLHFVDQNPDYQRMLHISIQSLRRFHPDWPVHVIQCQSPNVSLIRRCYRSISPWKRHLRFNRAGQDSRVFVEKTRAWPETPFESALFLDVDTVVLRPMDKVRALIEQHDVVIMPLDWKTYGAATPCHPDTIPYLMVGAIGYSRAFLRIYASYLEQLMPLLPGIAMPDQYLVSLLCLKEAECLDIHHHRSLQLDVVNMDREVGDACVPRPDGFLDLSWNRLLDFYVFHYNEYKPQYMRLIGRVWGLRHDD